METETDIQNNRYGYSCLQYTVYLEEFGVKVRNSRVHEGGFVYSRQGKIDIFIQLIKRSQTCERYDVIIRICYFICYICYFNV